MINIFTIGDAWEGELCSAKTCPGKDGPCNGHGTCNAISSECTCDPGWQADDCSEPQCLNDCSGKIDIFFILNIYDYIAHLLTTKL